MRKKLSLILLGITIIVYLVHLLFFGLFETTDSFFYWAFSEFIKTGKYFTPHPYNWTIPSTIEPPLYSVLLFVTQFFRRADVVIHLTHILVLFVSAFFLYQVIKNYVRQEIALIISLVFLLIPVHLIQTSSLMSETVALLFTSVILYLFQLIISNNEKSKINLLLLISSLAVLQRYNFLVFYGVAFLLFIFLKGKPKSSIFFAGLSILILFSWVLINHQINGAWGLSNSEGKHLYDRIVGGDKLLPPENNPNLVKLKSLTGENFDLKQPWWMLETAILPKLGTETRESELLGKVAVSALISHPADYAVNTVKNFFLIHGNGLVFPDKVYTYSRWMGTSCRNLGTIYFCNPIIKNGWGNHLWNSLVDIAEWYSYHLTASINFLLLFPALLFALTWRNKYIGLLAVLYVLSILLAVMTEVPVYRYLYPLYPLMTILIVYLLSRLTSFVISQSHR